MKGKVTATNVLKRNRAIGWKRGGQTNGEVRPGAFALNGVGADGVILVIGM